MSLPYPVDPSLPSNPTPLFSDSEAARGDHLRANNGEIWANFTYIVETILGNAVLSTDGTFASVVDTLFPSVKAIKTFIDSMFPHGIVMDYAGVTIPGTFWTACNGNSYLRASYPDCWANLSLSIGACTISQAAPAVVHIVGHGLPSGACVSFLSTGSLPSPLAVETNYYITKVDNDNFKVSTSFANYLAGTWVTTTNAGSGTHTLRFTPWGIVDSTHFNVPDFQGLSSEGAGQQAYAAWASVQYVGGLGQYKQDQMQGHRHPPLSGFTFLTRSGSSYYAGSNASGFTTYETTGDPVTDGSNGTPRTGSKTATPRVGINKMIRML